MNTYFVTGGTGVVGSAVVDALLRATTCQIRLLVRARSDEDLQTRLENVLDFCGASDELGRQRVTAIAGDTTVPRFGIAQEAYSRLLQECSHIIHCAGAVRMNLPIEQARRSAAGSARNVLQLSQDIVAVRQVQPKIEFVSTVGVGGKLGRPVPETWITDSRSFHNTYEQAKAEAEDLVRSASEDGTDVTVHRPSMVVGHSETGKVIHFQVFYHLAEFLSGRRTFGLFPSLTNGSLDLISSNRVADAIVWSSTTPDLRGKILHLCSGPQGAIGLYELRELVRRRFDLARLALPTVKDLPTPVFRALTRVAGAVSSGRKRRALSTLPVFLDYLADGQQFENASTARTLSHAGLALDKSAALIEPVLDFYLRRQYPAVK